MRTEELLSVIVPIYNASMYLERCVESILNQTYRNIDLILVDDGSSDNSGEICDRLAESDKRIRVYHIENQGVAIVRNYGVSIAQGELITFVDSDDWIEPGMYLYMMEIYDQYKPDIISSGIIYDDGNGGRTLECDLIEEGIYGKEQIVQEIIPFMMYDMKNHRRGVTPAVWNKIIRKKLWKEVKHGLEYKMTYGEDASIVYPCLVKAEKVFFINNAWYHYCVNNNSMVRSFDIDSFGKIKCFADYMEMVYTELGIWPQMEKQLKEYIKFFLYPAIEIVYGIKLDEPAYLFPYELVSANSRVVIYGAGRVGKAYMRNLVKTNYVKVMAWVDQAYNKLPDLKGQIQSPEILSSLIFDFVVIAIENEKTALKIRQDLVYIGVSQRNIIWKRPEMIGSEGIFE